MQNKTLTLGSLFDGSGGFPLGGLLAGIEPVWASEIEPFPIRVTTKRLPFMKHYGDISQMDGGKIEPVDIITFGSPCQDMSVAGKRAGLDGSRSNLFREAIRIVKEMRQKTNGKYPRYIVWENVPGAFSSNKGEDFKAVLEAVIGIVQPDTQVPTPEKNRWPYADCYMGDGWSVAYRVLDAQFWGVPQRRKRIYLVADFTGGRAFDILFKSEGLSGYSAEGFRSWQRTAGGAANRTGKASLCLNDPGDGNVPLVMKIRSGCEGGGKRPLLQKNKSATLSCNNDQTLFEPKVYGICAKDSNSMKSDNPNSGFYEAKTTRCLDGNGGNPSCNQGSIAVVCVDQGGGKSSCSVSEGLSPTLACTHGGEPVVCLQGSIIGRDDKNDPQGDGINEEVSFTLNTIDRHAVYAMTSGYTVRRLTPTECARLQGFPDNWCADLGTEKPTDEELYFWHKVFKTYSEITGGKMKSDKQVAKWLKDPHSDSAEYKMWGNGVALPCVYFVLSGIVWADGSAAKSNTQEEAQIIREV